MIQSRTIYVTDYDLQRLNEILWEAEQSGYRGSSYIKNLRAELERARVVIPSEVPEDVVTMNSKVCVVDLDSGEEITFTLVFPKDADVREDKISILAPIGTAVLGYRVGDLIEWEVPEGVKRLQVKELLYQPEAAGDYLL